MLDRSTGHDDPLEAARAALPLIPVPAFLWTLSDAADPVRPAASDITLEAVNDVYAHTVGIDARDFAGRSLDRIMPPRGAETILRRYWTTLHDGLHTYEEEIDVATGARVWSTALRTIAAPDGRPLGLLGAANDITEQRLREREDAGRISHLRRLADEVLVFSSVAAHDVRSPLGAVEALTDLVLEGFEDLGDGKIGLLRQCGAVARAAQRQMDDLLRHAVALEDTFGPMTEVDLGALCRDTAALVDPEARVAIEHPEARVRWDRVVLQIVVRNLLSNAVRHASKRVSLTLGTTGSAPVLTVSDDGDGFARGRDPFADDRCGRVETAHGFGLAAVRYLIETRGGTIAAVPSPFGRGAAVRVTLAGATME